MGEMKAEFLSVDEELKTLCRENAVVKGLSRVE